MYVIVSNDYNMHQLSSQELSKLLLNQSDKHLCELMLKKVQMKYKNLQEIWKRYAIDSKKGYQSLYKEHRNLKKEYNKRDAQLTKTINALNLAREKTQKMKDEINKHNLENKLRERRARKTRKK